MLCNMPTVTCVDLILGHAVPLIASFPPCPVRHHHTNALAAWLLVLPAT